MKLHYSWFLRCGQCGAWSYNDAEGECYLHTANACCGQKGKEESNSDWISGYFCIKCWSTEAGAECPCSLRKRLEGQLGCSLAQSSGAADDPQYKNPTVSIIWKYLQYTKLVKVYFKIFARYFIVFDDIIIKSTEAYLYLYNSE